MLHNYIEKDNEIAWGCRSCFYKEPITKDNPVVYEHKLQQDTSIEYSINPFLKHAPELPRFKNMTCKNSACPTRGKESDIVGIKLDPVNVVWMYQCAVCDTTWKQNAQGLTETSAAGTQGST
jgi:hypothetical protein